MHIFKQFVLERKSWLIRTAALTVSCVFALVLLAQNASAKMTYVIDDGGRRMVHTTTATNPEDVLEEAGLTLGAEDTYTTSEIVGISEIRIRRNMTVTVDYFGETMEVESTGETVKELLKRLNLSWSAKDEISQSLDAEVYDGMELRVYKLFQQEQTYSAVLEYKTQYCTDNTLPEGVEKVLTEGVDGEVICTAMVTYINGEETERTVLNERVIRQPVNEVIAVGCAEQEEQAEESVTYFIDDDTITLSTGEVLTYTDTIRSLATAYCDKGLTATGTQARVGAIAVDPKVIPYGTRMFIVSEDGEYIYGIATAEDTGSPRHIRGTRIDLHYDTLAECNTFGARYCTVYVLG